MANKKISDLTAITTIATGDIFPVYDVSDTTKTKNITYSEILSNTDTMTNKTLTSPVLQGDVGGWVGANETWTYASDDDPTYTFTIASFDATAKYSAGMKVKLTNASVKYFIITKVVFDDPGSTITVYGGTDYDLANSAITLPYYSTQKAPFGFPLDPDKWTVKTTGTSYADTSAGSTEEFDSTLRVSVPIGCWNHILNIARVGVTPVAASTEAVGTLGASSSASSFSDPEMKSDIKITGDASSAAWHIRIPLYKAMPKIITSKTTYYVVGDSASALFLGTFWEHKAICAYL